LFYAEVESIAEKLLDHRSDVFIIAAHRDLHVLNGGLRLKRISKPPS
jgi:hypothetical protein